jgi:hypothetical protein
VKYISYVLAKIAILDLGNVVLNENTINSILCVSKPNPAFTFRCICLNGTPLTWPKRHNCFTRPVGLRQESDLTNLTNKVLNCLAKRNKNECIQVVSDEDKKKDCEFCCSLYLCVELELYFIKTIVGWQQNLTLIFGRESKYEMKIQFPSVI